MSLNGSWELALSPSDDGIPGEFMGHVQVPGLGDMADFKIDSFGLAYSKKRNLWYRKKFHFENNAYSKVSLKIHKVKFGHTVYLNGEEIGGSNHCFTPSEYDISNQIIKGSENELIIRVGAFKDNLDEAVIYGADFEKIKYQPGIYDDVELILTGDERIANVQLAPDIIESKIRLGIVMEDAISKELKFRISEKKSGLAVIKGKLKDLNFKDSLALAEIQFNDFTMWSPENPFLYVFELESANDMYTTTFGMRSFEFNQSTGLAELNGDNYFMRGTNVCIFRFFEDPDRNGLPWDTTWVRNLHKKFKSMHWNSIRYCISAPPQFWYDIADEEGLLIQDEYPVWTGITSGEKNGFEAIYPGVTAESLALEYKDWMQERWNHPSIVIWDAQNESVTEVTGDAIKMVRDLDMSGRPWENGWARPQADSDPMETHPYRFTNYLGAKVSSKGPLKELISSVQVPDNGPSERMPPEDGGQYNNPILINEYGWLWLNRDGSTTTLTDWVYPNAFGPNLNTEEMLEIYGRHLGILSEYWRAHRTSAGVLHFCGLAYSRSGEPRGQTSDHFIDIKNLVFEANFEKYVKSAFNPVGAFINWFELVVPAGEEIQIPTILINDLNEQVNTRLQLAWHKNDQILLIEEQEISLKPFQKTDINFKVKVPKEPGTYELELKLSYRDETVKSLRLCRVE